MPLLKDKVLKLSSKSLDNDWLIGEYKTNMSNQLNYAEYDRKSSEQKERQALSIKEQKAECAKVIAREKLKISLFLQEERSAFKPNNRPEFDKMISLIEQKKINAILTWKPDRLCRNPKEGGLLLQLLQDDVLKEIRCAEGEVYTPESDHLILQIHFGMANQYSRNLSKNVKRANRYIFSTEKRWLSYAKPGWLNVFNPENPREKGISVDPERMPILSKALRLIITGSYTPMQVLNKLNDEWGYRTRKTKSLGGKPMKKSAWYRLLSDPYLYGLMVRKQEGKLVEEMVADSSLIMLSKEEFDMLQIMLGRKGKPRVSKHEFAYKEVLKCGECGGSITAEEKWQIICPVCKTKFAKSKNRDCCKGCGLLIEEMKSPKILHYVHFHCTKRVNPKCTQKSIALNVLEQQIDEELAKFEIKKEFKDWAIKYLNELNDKESSERVVSQNNVKKAHSDVSKRLDNLLNVYISPQNATKEVLNDEEYVQQKKLLQAEQQSLAGQIKQIDVQQNNWHELSVKTFNFACYARYWFAHGTLKEKTEILGALGSNLTITDKKLRVEGLNPFLIIADGTRRVEKLSKKFEPALKPDVTGQMVPLEAISQSWLRD